jgi:threonine dehydrogenase-like Zn-dependent dehydrogenase
MKKVVITGERRAEVVDVPEPQPIDNWVVVKIHAAPMCAEYKEFLGGKPTDLLGHEAAGEVVAVDRSSRLKVGDRVVAMPRYGCGECLFCVSGDYIHCETTAHLTQYLGGEGRATYAQYLLKQDWLLPKIPDDVSYEHASLACCGLGPSFGAMQTMGVDAFTTLLITGAGPVGLGAVVNAQFRGARTIVVESVPYRVERAKALGAAVVLDPRDEDIVEQIRALTTDGRGVDAALDCSGNVQAERHCIDATRRKGKVSFIGECHNDLAIRISPDMIRKGLTLIGSWHYNLHDFPKIMQVIQKSPLLDLLISHVMPMSEIQEAFQCSSSHDSAKIILHPWA